MAKKRSGRLRETQLSPEGLGAAKIALLIIDGQYAVQYRDKKQLHCRFISPRAVRSAFSKEKIDSGWIPEGVARWGFGSEGEWFLRYYEPAVRTIYLEEEKQKPSPLTIKFPGLLFAGHARDYYLFALKEPMSADAQLFKAPLPNVGTDGHICFGGNQVPPVSMSNIGVTWDLLWSAPFNDHMRNGKSIAFKDDIREVLRAVAKNSADYPLDDLVAGTRSLSAFVGALGREDSSTQALRLDEEDEEDMGEEGLYEDDNDD